jgi:hypothetical protein
LTLHRLEEVSIASEKRYLKRGRPSADTPFELRYRIQARLLRDEAAVDNKKPVQGASSSPATHSTLNALATTSSWLSTRRNKVPNEDFAF